MTFAPSLIWSNVSISKISPKASLSKLRASNESSIATPLAPASIKIFETASTASLVVKTDT